MHLVGATWASDECLDDPSPPRERINKTEESIVDTEHTGHATRPPEVVASRDQGIDVQVCMKC